MNAGGEDKQAAAGLGKASRKRLALFLLCLASFMAVAETIITVALTSMRRELSFSGGDAQWILSGYMLAFGGLLLLCGRAADLWGRRRLFMAGLALFAVASLVDGLSWVPWALVAARFLQGAGAAASLSLLTSVFVGAERDRAVGIYSAAGTLGFVVGTVGGGLSTELLGQRWVMFINAPVALVALLLAPAAVPESRKAGAPRSLDPAGA